MKRIGLALGKGTAWATPLDGGVPSAPTIWSGRWPAQDARQGLHALLDELRAAFGVRRARVHVALLPELCQLRRVTLPPLREQERRDVMARTLPRLLPGGSVPQAFGAAPDSSGGLLLAAAPGALVEALEDSVPAVGWRLAAVLPAEAAWAAAARAASPEVRRVLVSLTDRLELLLLTKAEVERVRRLPRKVADRERAAEWLREAIAVDSDAPALAVVSEDADRGFLHEVAAASGSQVLDVDAELAPGALAAAFADRSRGPEIVTDARWTARRAAVRRATRTLATAAGVLLVLSGAAQWWGAERELAALRTERAANANAVAEALDRRQQVANLMERYAVLRSDSVDGRRWSQVLGVVAGRLPRTAYLTAFRAAGDSFALEGVAREAGPVLDALRAAPQVAALRATAPIRRETRDNGTAVERFALGARLVAAGRPQ